MKKILSAFALMLHVAVPAWAAGGEVVDVYKSPHCGCCGKWIRHLQQAGFTVKAHDLDNVASMREKLGMPERYGSCHSATVAGYLVEGHVPASDIKRMLKERPAALGLAVPGMPQGAPGMETPTPLAYNTLLIRRDGSASVYVGH